MFIIVFQYYFSFSWCEFVGERAFVSVRVCVRVNEGVRVYRDIQIVYFDDSSFFRILSFSFAVISQFSNFQ